MGGGDKPLLKLKGSSLLAHAVSRLTPQCQGVILSANGDPSRFEKAGLPVVTDSLPGHLGPLAGILAALEWTALHRPSIEWVASAPGDTPFLPGDLVPRLHEARQAGGRMLACASSGPRDHPVIGLWPVALRHDLRDAITVKGLRSVRDWSGLHGVAKALWPCEPFDPFFNINTPEDLIEAEALVERHGIAI